MIDKLKSYGDKMIQSEALVAMQYPVYDFRYRADPDSPFRLYNTLIPQLKEHDIKDDNIAQAILK